MRSALVPVLFTALIAGCQKAPVEKEGTDVTAKEASVSVEKVVASERPMPKALRLTGSLVASEMADIAANAAGRVAKTFVERGSQVKLGDPLVQLDMHMVRFGAEEAHANLEVVQAQRQLADQQCQRNHALFDKGAISKEEWDRIDNACKSAQSSVQASMARARQANRSLDDATVRAPFAGQISERYVSVGEYVGQASRVVALTQQNPLRLRVGIPEASVGAIKSESKVSFSVEAFPQESFEGAIKYISPSVRPDSRDVVIEAEVDNKDGRLKPGMFADVHLDLPKMPALAVPITALKRDADGARIFAIEGDHVEEHMVSVGAQFEGYVTIIRGLNPGTSVVAKLPDNIRDGMTIR